MSRSATFPRPRPAVVGPTIALALVIASGSAALAQGAAVTVEPVGPLPQGATTLTVTGQGFATSGNGVYVVFGPITPAPGYYMDPSLYGAFKWVSPGGADSPATAPLAEDGSFATTLDITSVMTNSAGEVDCATTPCAVITFAAHGSPDRSQDTCTSITFLGAAVASGSPTTMPLPPASVPVPVPVASVDPSASLIPAADDPCSVIGAPAP